MAILVRMNVDLFYLQPVHVVEDITVFDTRQRDISHRTFHHQTSHPGGSFDFADSMLATPLRHSREAIMLPDASAWNKISYPCEMMVF